MSIKKTAELEYDAIRYIDEFIDARRQQFGVDYAVPLVSFQGRVGLLAADDQELLNYIGRNATAVEEFITDRPYLWSVKVETGERDHRRALAAEKIPRDERKALVEVLRYVERKSTGPDGSAKLNGISIQLGQNHVSIKDWLGSGLQPVRDWLLSFPCLFKMLPFNPHLTQLGDALFIHCAKVVKDVIILPEKTISAASGNTSTPTHLEGAGYVVRVLPSFGFICHEKSGQEAYFSAATLFDGKTDHKHQNLCNYVFVGDRFRFEAYVSGDYEEGKTENKWRVNRMVSLDPKHPLLTPGYKFTERSAGVDVTDEQPWARGDWTASGISRPASSSCLSSNQGSVTAHCGSSVRSNPSVSSCSVSSISPKGAGEKASTSQKSTKKIANENAEKRSVQCQTDVDDREILLRLLRTSPDLMELVRIMRSNE